MSHSVHKSVTVQAARDVAFGVFTERMTSWWPEAHHIGKSPLKEVIVEPRVGGRWAERCVDGSECEWGRVVVWEPPARVVLAWQLNADFEYDASFVTEVEVRFVAEGDMRTRVELEHRNLDRFGEREAQMVAAFDSDAGWLEGLERFADRVASNGKKPFLLRLIPPRPTFAQDMSETERRVMNEHIAYWTGHAAARTAIAFGPVADPKGGWGMAIVEVEDDAAVRKLIEQDPVTRGAIGARYEMFPMPNIILRR